MNHYSVGEIFRLGLLKNAQGEPYKHKESVKNVVRKMKLKRVPLVHGLGYQVPEDKIVEHNLHWRSYADAVAYLNS